MGSLRRATKQFLRSDDRKGWVASQVGLPAVGSRMLNQHGIEWIVRDHAPVPTIQTVDRWNKGGPVPTEDLYPVVEPLNLSPKLVEFLHAIDRCTTKSFAIVDTMPGRRKDGHIPGGNHIDTVCHPETNILFLDAGRVNETVIAHELGHAWLQYVEMCEDLRTTHPEADPVRARMVSYVQSFVLDIRVNALLGEKGFDLRPIEEDQSATLSQLSTALRAGYQPETANEEVFMALLVADAKVCYATQDSSLVRLAQSLPAICAARPELDRLSGAFANAVIRNGHTSAGAVEQAVDECLAAAFASVGAIFDAKAELVRVDPLEPDRDMFPRWLPSITPRHKCEVGRHMALNGVSLDWPVSMVPTLAGRARFVFTAPDGSSENEVVVNQQIGPPTRYEGMEEDTAFCAEFNRQTKERMTRTHVPSALTPAPSPDHSRLDLPARPRNYMAGTGRFLTAVRQEEWLAGEHPYGYAFDSPGLYIDPTGNAPCFPPHPCATYPTGPCEYAKSIGDDKGDGGGVVCCEGKAYACAWYPGRQPGIKSCLVEHERRHIQDLGGCVTSGYDRQKRVDDFVECSANVTEISCLLRRRKTECDKFSGTARSDCLKDFRDRICQLCKVLDKHRCPKPNRCKYC